MLISMNMSKAVVLVGSLAFLIVDAEPTRGQVPAVTCQAIAENIVTNSNGADLIADIPSKGTAISEQVFTRVPTPPGGSPTPWMPCDFGKECNKAIFGMPSTRLDAQDQATTWVAHVQADCAGGNGVVNCSTAWVRLVLTYSLVPTTGQCISQATFPIGAGVDFELSLRAPAPGAGMSWTGSMREQENGSQWSFCDGTNLDHMCGPQKHFFFSQAKQQPADEADHNPGMFFSCTNKFAQITGYVNGQPIEQTFDGPPRWCRAAVYYFPPGAPGFGF